MNAFSIALAISCLALTARARPGIGHTGLVGIPDLQTFGEIKYPKYDIIDLGEYSKGFLPGDSIHESKHVTIKEPQPYPVKIPVPHPYPVPVSKPYPVVQTKYVKVPYAVPYEIVKQVPVPVEVPKPYPVHVSHGDSHGAGSSYDQGSFNNGHSEQSSAYETEESNDASEHVQQDLGNNSWTPIEH